MVQMRPHRKMESEKMRPHRKMESEKKQTKTKQHLGGAIPVLNVANCGISSFLAYCLKLVHNLFLLNIAEERQSELDINFTAYPYFTLDLN